LRLRGCIQVQLARNPNPNEDGGRKARGGGLLLQPSEPRGRFSACGVQSFAPPGMAKAKDPTILVGKGPRVEKPAVYLPGGKYGAQLE